MKNPALDRTLSRLACANLSTASSASLGPRSPSARESLRSTSPLEMRPSATISWSLRPTWWKSRFSARCAMASPSSPPPRPPSASPSRRMMPSRKPDLLVTRASDDSRRRCTARSALS